MTYVIAEPCINVKDGACIDVCPVDCIHPTPGENDDSAHAQLSINPDERMIVGHVNRPALS